MFCVVCQSNLIDCTCPDIEERLADLANHPNMSIRICRICGLHYARCDCDAPDWGVTGDGNDTKKD